MVKIRIPATSANLGCGFDTLGLALTLYTTFEFTLQDNVEFEGFEPRFNNTNNLVYQSLLTTLKKLNKTISGVKISICNDIPISRGLGSSATCVVAGVYGAFLLTKTPIHQQTIFEIATEIEGHPDNVAPAIFGNLCASFLDDQKQAICVQYQVDSRYQFLALIPNFETSTAQARQVMPSNVPLTDAIYSLSRLGVVLKAFETYNPYLLQKAMNDKLHEPYRQKIIHEYDTVKHICQKYNSIAFFISGSGSTLINVVDDLEKVNTIKSELAKLQYNWQLYVLNVDTNGCLIMEDNL